MALIDLTRPHARRLASALVFEGLLAREGTDRPNSLLRFHLTAAGRKALQAGQAGISERPASEPSALQYGARDKVS